MLLGGTSNRGTVPRVAPTGVPTPSPSSAGSRSSGTWRPLILADTRGAPRHQNASLSPRWTSSCVTRRPDITVERRCAPTSRVNGLPKKRVASRVHGHSTRAVPLSEALHLPNPHVRPRHLSLRPATGRERWWIDYRHYYRSERAWPAIEEIRERHLAKSWRVARSRTCAGLATTIECVNG